MSKKVTLLEELKRYNDINKYVKKLVNEQEDPNSTLNGTETPAPQDAPAGPNTVPPTDSNVIPPSDPNTVPPVEPEADDTTEEIDITDLVNMTKSIKKDLNDNKDNGVLKKMDDVFSKLNDLEQKLNGMDQLINKIDNLEVNIKNSMPKTPEEKLEMRSLDSYPFSKNPQEFFDDKLQQMRMAGKNEYVLTKDDINNYSKNEIMKSFNTDDDTDYNSTTY